MRKQNRIYGIKENAIQFKHGQCFEKKVTRLYAVWTHMISRCEKTYDGSYKNYGGRGIAVCKEWYNPKIFFEWALTHGYDNKLTIDRKDNNGNYEPSNCHFVTYLENNMNRRKRFLYGLSKTKSNKWSITIGKRIDGEDKLFYGGRYSCIALALMKRDELKQKLDSYESST